MPNPKPAFSDEALRNFDTLPDSARVRGPVAAAWLGLSMPTLYRLTKRGDLEKPLKVGSKITLYSVGDLRRFAETKAA